MYFCSGLPVVNHLSKTVAGKLVLATGLSITLILAGYISFSGWQASQKADSQVMELATEQAGEIAQTVAVQITQATSAGAAVGGALQGYMATGTATTTNVIEMLRGVPTQYDTVFSAWMAGMPNVPAFGGYFADAFVGREAVEGLEPSCEVVGCHKVREVRAQLVVAVVMVPFDSGLLDRAVHPLDLTIRPGMVRLGKPMLDPICLADHVEPHLPE